MLCKVPILVLGNEDKIFEKELEGCLYWSWVFIHYCINSCLLIS